MARYIPNPAFKAELMAEPSYQRAMHSTANEVARYVRASAPVQTGYYRRSIKTRGATVYSTDSFAHLIEWGSSRNPAYAPLRRGVRAAGLRLRESPKP
jgi:hypothetical protein